MSGLAVMMPINGQPFFVAAAMIMGLSGTTAIAAGWMLHIVTGLIVGTIFGVAITKVNAFRVTNLKRGLGWGLGVGVLVFVIFFLPLMMLSGMAVMLGPQLMTMAAGAFAAHLIYGLFLGGIVGVALPRISQAYKCQICGAGFHSESELMQHGNTHMAKTTATREYNCPTCGASFKSQTELMQHADEHTVLAC
jgi:DNA-directed RNA polymerase subunit RPC12/RpoP